MTRMFVIVLLLASVPARAAPPADAGPDSTRPPPTSLVRALDRIPLASSLRVEANTHVSLEGTLAQWDVHSLRLSASARESEIPLSSVRRLWVRGRATGHGAKVGAITLGIVGAVAGAFLAEFGAEGGFEGGGSPATAGQYVVGVLAGAAAGGAMGALVGAGVGAAFPRWHRRFP